MNLENSISKLSTEIDKSETYLKGLHTQEKNKLSEQFGDALPDSRIDELAFSKIAKKYEVDKNKINELINGDELTEEEYSEEENIDDLLDDDEDTLIEIDDVDDLEDPPEKETREAGFKSWKEAFKGIPEPKTFKKNDGEYEKTPSLIVEIGPTYHLKVKTDEDVYTGEFEGKYGKYNRTAFKVELVKVSDSALYDMKYTKGDFKGQPAFKNGRTYTIWMDDKCFGHFKMFWIKVRGEPVPDDRVFTFRKSKQGNYNVWTFGEA